MAIGKLWAGRIFGTNTGNVFVKLEGEDAALTGTLHFNEPGIGFVVYAIKGRFDGQALILAGDPQAQLEGVTLGQLTATATLNTRGEFSGEWATSIGSAGTFLLYPHDAANGIEAGSGTMPDQLHTARYHFGAVEIDRQQITAIADEIQRDFGKSQVIVTVTSDTEQSRFLADFKTVTFSADRATVIKLFVQETEGNGVNRIAQVEFGPQINLVMTQSSDEAWVLGMLEKLKRSVRPFERAYTTNFKKFGFGINQLLLVGAIIFLPSLITLRDRAILMVGVLVLIFCVDWLHGKYLPFAAIYLSQKPKGLFARVAPSAFSWIIAVSASVAAALLGAYLKGLLQFPSP
jgi:hypothetical protein